MLHVLVVVQDAEQSRRLEEQLRSIGAVYQVAPEITADHIAFAYRLGDVAVLAGGEDPLGQLAYLRLAGVDLPVVVFWDVAKRASQTQLLQGGAAACARFPRTGAELLSVLTSAVEHRRSVLAPAQQDVALDPVGLTVRGREGTAKLTRREYALLHCLVSRAGRPVSIARLQTHTWGEALPRRSAAQIVTVYVHQLRRKLSDVGLPEAIVTVRNYGYLFVPSARSEGAGGEGSHR
jgi:DNA-binding response OmpR family regulator